MENEFTFIISLMASYIPHQINVRALLFYKFQFFVNALFVYIKRDIKK